MLVIFRLFTHKTEYSNSFSAMKPWKAIHGISYGRQCYQSCSQSTVQQLRRAVLLALQPIQSAAATEGSAANLAAHPQYSSYGRQCLPTLQPIHSTAATEGSAASLVTNPQYSSYGRECLPTLQPIHSTAATEGSAANLVTSPQYSCHTKPQSYTSRRIAVT